MKSQTKKLIIVFVLMITSIIAKSQVGIGTNSPNASAKLEVSSTTQGFLPPRMTTIQRDAITTPATGLIIFNTTTNSLEFKSSFGWTSIISENKLSSVQIGTQIWMDKNLDVSTYRNGDLIPQVKDATAWAALTTGAWCYYENDSAGYSNLGYGKLYNWYAVNDTRGLAPLGWHIPTDVEWGTLETTLGGNSVAGGKMKSPGTLKWASPNTGADNPSGFLGYPGGARGSNGTFGGVGMTGNWWSSYDFVSYPNGLVYQLDYNGGGGALLPANKCSGHSVRCVKD